MSTVTLSKPHCAIISAEKPDGIASQAFTTVLPEAQICLTLFGIGCVSFCRFAGVELARGPLNAHFADANLTRGVYYRRPGIVRQGDAVPGALGAHFALGIARDQHLFDTCNRLGCPDEIDVTRDLAVEEVGGVDDIRVDIERQHTVGEPPVRRGRTSSGQGAAEQFADERKPRSLVLADSPDRPGALAWSRGPSGV